jgi:hypothetical protein
VDPHWFGSLDPDLDPHLGKRLDPDPETPGTSNQCWAQIRYSLPVTVTSYKLLTQSYWWPSLGKLHVTHKLLL